MLAVQYPDHPKLDPDRTGQRVRPADTTTVFRYVQAAAETDNGRVEVAKADRPVMRRVAGPLGLGEVHEAAFVLGRRWIEVFREAAPPRNSAGDLPVRELLRLLGDNGRYGLEAHVAALVVATYAEQTDRAWVRHGVPLDPAPGLGGITTDMALPEAADWATAGERGGRIFGIRAATLLRGRLVRDFAGRVAAAARERLADARTLVDALEGHGARLGLDPLATAGRLHTAHRALDLLAALDAAASPAELVTVLARADLGGPADRLAKSITTARQVREALDATQWSYLEMLDGLPEPHGTRGRAILADLSEAGGHDELTTSLAPDLRAASSAATTTVADALRRAAPARTPLVQPPGLGQAGTSGGNGTAVDLTSTPSPTVSRPGGGPEPMPSNPEQGDQRVPAGFRVWRVAGGDLDSLERAVEELRRLAADRRGEIELTWRLVP